MKRLLVPAAILFFILSLPGAAQKHASSGSNHPRATASDPHQLVSVKATGTTRYTDKEILGASGLQIGQDVAEGDLKEAAQRLGESGVFSSVVYTFSYSDAGLKVEFQLTENEKNKLVPTHFENFVWFTDAELMAALNQRVPLFKDAVPTSGTMADHVQEALQELLSERHLPGRVEFLRQSTQDGSRLTGIEYRVAEITTSIRDVEFPGASPEQIAFLRRAAHALLDAEYFRSKLAAVAQFDLLPLYLERGYLKAAFGPSEARVVNQSGDTTRDTKAEAAKTEDIDPSDIEVDVILPVIPGKVYSISGVTWKGNSAITTEESSKVFHLAVNRPADAVRVTDDAENLVRLYHSRGYMTAEVKPVAQLDDEKGTVRYYVNISEGDLYKMGELEIVGVDTPSKDRLNEAWTLREGQPYNADYTRKFLDDARRLLPRGLQFSASINEQLDKKDKVVDVTIQFKVQ
ncbi:MAG: POTRA domain-containing protein [Terriglobales bacterium]